MIIKRLLEHKKIWFGLATSWTVLIFILCLAKMNDLPSLGVKGMDKYVHFTFHFVFTFLWAIVVKSRFSTISNKKILNIILISLVMGITIEVLQENFTTTRKADILDVMANLTGAISAGILISFFENKKIIN